MATWEEIVEDFDVLDDWEDRYRYVIELGRKLPVLDPALKTDSSKVQGCVSQVWLIATPHTPQNDAASSGAAPTLRFQGASDAAIVQGLIAILFALYQDKTADEILAVHAEQRLATLGLDDHLTPQRSNGLAAMITRIRTEAEHVASAA